MVLFWLYLFLAPVFQCLSINGSVKIRIGVNIGFDSSDLSMVDLPQAVFIRAHHLNQIRDLVHPNASVEIVFVNNRLQKSTTIQNSIELANQGVIGVIGSTYSSLTELGSLITQPYHLPLCDGGATSPSLSNKQIYSNFFRTIPNDAAQAETMVQFLRAQGWNKVGIVYSTESYGQNLATFFSNFARASNVSILSSQPIYPGSDNNKLLNAVKNLRDSNAQIFVYFGYVEDYVGLIANAKREGIYGRGYNWIAADALAFILSTNLDRSLYAGTSYFFPVEGSRGFM
jgi:ABC-type branched-subunit amino acid transport system substrate-binding protein